MALVLAGGAASARASDVSVEVTDAEGMYHVRGTFTVEVALETAWDVLSDYERIGTFVKSVKTSEFVAGPKGERVLRQDAVAGPFLFRRTVRVELLLDEQIARSIAFRDVLGRDFSHYVGSWALTAAGDGHTRVEYTLDADPVASVPGLFGRGAMSRSARDLLTQVRAEMRRREGALGEDK